MDFQLNQYGFIFNPKTVKSGEVKEHIGKEENNLQNLIDTLYSDSNSREKGNKKWIS